MAITRLTSWIRCVRPGFADFLEIGGHLLVAVGMWVPGSLNRISLWPHTVSAHIGSKISPFCVLVSCGYTGKPIYQYVPDASPYQYK